LFKIAKHLVQESSPAEIPLTAVRLVEKRLDAPRIKVPPPEISPQESQRAAEVDNILKQARREADIRLTEAEAAAAELLAKIREAAALEAEAKVAEAGRQVQNILEEARRRGREEGRLEGLELYRQQTEEASREISRLLKEIASAREALFASFEGEVVELALNIAEKITLTALSKDETIFKAMVANALKNLRREGKISLRISEQQYNDFFNAESASFVLDDETIRISVINDPHLENGALIVESAEESVDAGVASQLKYIALAFGQPGDGE
jgi:flagellar assembly protein FliH